MPTRREPESLVRCRACAWVHGVKDTEPGDLVNDRSTCVRRGRNGGFTAAAGSLNLRECATLGYDEPRRADPDAGAARAGSVGRDRTGRLGAQDQRLLRFACQRKA